MYMYLCMYVRVYTHTFMHAHVCIYVHTSLNAYIPRQIVVQRSSFVCKFMDTYIVFMSYVDM